MTWVAIGLALCSVLSLFAFARSKRPYSSFYARDVYGMSSRTHALYAVIFAAGAAAFAVALAFSAIPAVPLLGIYVLIAVFYLSSFARGFEDS